MKKVSIFLGGAILAIGLVACGGNKETTSEKLKVGFTAYKYDDNFIALFRQVINDEASKVANTVDLQMNDSQNSQTTQNDQIDVMLSKGVVSLALILLIPHQEPQF